MDKQEPAAWMWDIYNGAGYTSRGIDFFPTDIPFAKNTPLYTESLQQREWINLTVQEREKLRDEYEDNLSGLISAVQMMLKDKNNV